LHGPGSDDARAGRLGTPIKTFTEIAESRHGIALKELCPHATEVVRDLQNAGFEAYIVGGGVRDLLMGKAPKDFDVATNATPEEVHQIFPRCRLIGRRFRLAHVRKSGTLVEVATFRGQGIEAGDREELNGRILRDNVWGSVEEDALRRDFTINAMFLDPVSGIIRDYVGGYQDLADKRLRLIGEPELRYREDPVRLLRAARFVAKLGVEPDAGTEEPLRSFAPLLSSVPPARLFEEVCKLFLTGHGLRSLDALQRFGLSSSLFPALPRGSGVGQVKTGTLLRKALENTDARIREGKSVTPGFLFAAFLWQPVAERSLALMADGVAINDAQTMAADEVFYAQSRSTAIPRRFSTVSRQIWSLQPRLGRITGKRWKRLLAEPRFRAAYDFLLLRAADDASLREVAAFWTRIQSEIQLPDQSDTDRKEPYRRRPRTRRRSVSRR